MDVEGLRARLREHGQEHLLHFWPQLSEAEREGLYRDLVAIDLVALKGAFERCMAAEGGDGGGAPLDERLAPLPDSVLGSVIRTDPATLRLYEQEGLRQIAGGKVAVLLLAGGQGTRLGVTYPKGMYDVGLPSHKSLYQLQAERLIKVQQLAQQLTGTEGTVPWYIMTSEQTREPTESYFERHAYFGLSRTDVVLFEQSTLPCLDLEGHVLLETRSSIARAPDGNGGLYSALARRGVLDDMRRRGVAFIHVYCVDNILVKMADPVFIGFCIAKGACCGAKVVEKTQPTEPVGVICRLDGCYHVVEYSEISLATAERRDTHGKLVFNAGGIANHFFTTDFMQIIVKEKEASLRHHVAKKKIAFCDPVTGELVRPTRVNGIKLEKFVFDVFEFAPSFAVWEVLREAEFSPLKNADGAAKDTPTTSRHALLDLHHHWVLRAGGSFIRPDGSLLSDIPSAGNNNNCSDSRAVDCEEPPIVCEISPLVSYDGEGLEERVRGKGLISPLSIVSEGEKNPTPSA